MTKKTLIFLGLVLLVSGIVLRIVSGGSLSIILMIAGALLKFTYLGLSVRDKSYKPGKEFFLLYVGLAIFFTGIYLRKNGIEGFLIFMITGIAMKVSFVLLFISKLRKNRVAM